MKAFTGSGHRNGRRVHHIPKPPGNIRRRAVQIEVERHLAAAPAGLIIAPHPFYDLVHLGSGLQTKIERHRAPGSVDGQCGPVIGGVKIENFTGVDNTVIVEIIPGENIAFFYIGNISGGGPRRNSVDKDVRVRIRCRGGNICKPF